MHDIYDTQICNGIRYCVTCTALCRKPCATNWETDLMAPNGLEWKSDDSHLIKLTGWHFIQEASVLLK